MPIYLAPWTGSGTRQDPFQPLGVDGQPSWSCFDLRPDASTLDGGGINACILAVTNPIVDPNVIDLGQLGSTLPANTRRRIENWLGIPTLDNLTLLEIIAQLLINPPPGKWGRILPAGDKYEIWLNNQLIYTQPV